MRLAVSVSAVELRAKNFVTGVHATLAETRLEPRYLELELTESMMMDNVELAVAALSTLKAMGIKLSIDDFGTGYSSLSYLKRFPIDVLKIDQSFISDITLAPDGAPIVHSIITLAHSLKLKVIAEGVETAEQLEYLGAHQCDVMQGYYFSRPLSAADFEQLLRKNTMLQCPQVAADTTTLI